MYKKGNVKRIRNSEFGIPNNFLDGFIVIKVVLRAFFIINSEFTIPNFLFMRKNSTKADKKA